MDGREFLESARLLRATPCEANWRSAAGRSYVALLNEALAALERWGFPLRGRKDVSKFVVARFNSDRITKLLSVKLALDQLHTLAREADHTLSFSGSFADGTIVDRQFFLAEGLITMLDEIESDPIRRADAIADIRARWP